MTRRHSVPAPLRAQARGEEATLPDALFSLTAALFALSAFACLLVSSLWPPPRDLDVAASEAWTACFSRVAWTPAALALTCAAVFVGSLGIGALGHVRRRVAFLATVAPYPVLCIIELSVHPDSHNLLPIEWVFHAPLALLGLAAMLGTHLGRRRLGSPRHRATRGSGQGCELSHHDGQCVDVERPRSTEPG